MIPSADQSYYFLLNKPDLLSNDNTFLVPIPSGVKSILKQNLIKSIVTDGKTTRNKVESIDWKKHLSKSKKVVI